MLYTTHDENEQGGGGADAGTGYEVIEHNMTPPQRKKTGDTGVFEPTRETPRQEYRRAEQERPVRAVLDGEMTALEACRHFHIQSNQLYAWLGKATLEQWPTVWPSILAYVAGQQERIGGPSPIGLKATRVEGSDVPMIPLDMATQLKLTIADMWIAEHSSELMTATLPGTTQGGLLGMLLGPKPKPGRK